jgi:hypothetical protein
MTTVCVATAFRWAIKLVHLVFRDKIAATCSVHSRTYRNSLFVRQSIHAAATRFDFAGDVGEFFPVLFRPGLNPL